MYDNKILLTSKNQIALLCENKIKYFSDDDINQGTYQCKFSIIPNETTVFIFDELKRIQTYNENFEYQSTYQYVYSNSLYNLGNIVSVCKDYSGKAYFVDALNNKILNLLADDNYITELDFNFEFTFDSSTKISVNPNGNLFAIYNNHFVYIIDLTNNIMIKKISCNDIIDLKFDYINNLFLISSNKIEKYAHDSYLLENFIDIDFNIKSSSLNIETGELYLLSDNLYKFYKDDFCANASKDSPPVDISNLSLSNDLCTFIKIKNQTKLFATCVSFSSSDMVEKNSIAICLKINIEQNDKMCYCLLKINSLEKLGYINKDDIEILQMQTISKTVLTVCKNVKIYTLPSKNSKLFSTIKNEDSILTAISNLEGFSDEENHLYFAVLTENGVGYIEQKYLAEMGNFESSAVELKQENFYEKEFVSYIIIIVSLTLITIALCVIVAKKKY